MLEFGASPAIGAKTAKPLITMGKSLPELNPPKHRGKLTIADVYKASSTQEHQRIARAYAKSVWDTWQAHHDWATQRLKEL